jgi:hypothetical protein
LVSFEESQNNPIKPSVLFDNMFSEPSPWPIAGYGSSNDTNFIGRRKFRTG